MTRPFLKGYSIIGFFLFSFCVFPLTSFANSEVIKGQDSRFENGRTLFDKFCVRCHGEKANGEGPMTIKIYRPNGTELPANFTKGNFINRPEEYLKKMIAEGGEKNQRSQYMPPFGKEISAQGIDDLIYFIKQTAYISQVR